MSRFLIQSVTWDEDDVCTISYLDKSDALRKDGHIWRSCNVSLSPEAGGLYQDAQDIHEAVLELLGDLVQVFRDEAPYVPGDEPDEEDEDDSMGSSIRV